MSELLDPDGLIRRLKRGAPLLLAAETVRLPRFTEIKEMSAADLGAPGTETFVVARSRTATWAMLPLAAKRRFSKKDAEAFLQVIEALQVQSPQKPVKGYVISQTPLAPEISQLFGPGGHVASAVAE